jgi:DNA-binding PadR family transcriptional regulator
MVEPMATRVRSNPLALAVLCCLYERPMHPYEIARTLRTRAKHESIRLNYGSLYGVVASLERRGMVRAAGTVREGRRPERTVYEVTDVGAEEMAEWLSELIAVPAKEYTQFEAALSLLGGLPPDEVIPLLHERCQSIEWSIEQRRATHEALQKRGLPRAFWVESEYVAALAQAELDFTRRLVADLESGDMEGIEEWRSWHAGGPPPSAGGADDKGGQDR